MTMQVMVVNDVVLTDNAVVYHHLWVLDFLIHVFDYVVMVSCVGMLALRGRALAFSSRHKETRVKGTIFTRIV